MGKKSGGRVRVKQMGGPKMPMNPLADLAIPPEEMIHLPKKPDSNSGIMVWPLGAFCRPLCKVIFALVRGSETHTVN